MERWRPNRRRPYRRWLSRRLGRDILIVGWLVACGMLTNQLSVPVEAAVWIFFLGAPAIIVSAPAITRVIRRQRFRAAARGERLKLGHFVGLVATISAAIFFVALAWPLAEASSHQPVDLPSREDHPATFSCRVTNVHDGDTLRCAGGSRVRLHAVAARELDETCTAGHPCPSASGKSAREALVRLAADRTLKCRQIGNSYNRVTAICTNDAGIEINCGMIQSGTAIVWDRFDREAPICQS